MTPKLQRSSRPTLISSVTGEMWLPLARCVPSPAMCWVIQGRGVRQWPLLASVWGPALPAPQLAVASPCGRGQGGQSLH